MNTLVSLIRAQHASEKQQPGPEKKNNNLFTFLNDNEIIMRKCGLIKL